MPCICSNKDCQRPCPCDEILCTSCLMDVLIKSNYQIGDNEGHPAPADDNRNDTR